jgi:ribonuclease HII
VNKQTYDWYISTSEQTNIWLIHINKWTNTHMTDTYQQVNKQTYDWYISISEQTNIWLIHINKWTNKHMTDTYQQVNKHTYDWYISTSEQTHIWLIHINKWTNKHMTDTYQQVNLILIMPVRTTTNLLFVDTCTILKNRKRVTIWFNNIVVYVYRYMMTGRRTPTYHIGFFFKLHQYIIYHLP